MARLRNLPSRLAPAPDRLGWADRRGPAGGGTGASAAGPGGAPAWSRSRYRDATQPWNAWYKTARWQKLRWSVLVRDLFTCALCSRLEADSSRLVCDHVERHGGDDERFWAGPFQTLCKGCHDGVKQRREKAAGRTW